MRLSQDLKKAVDRPVFLFNASEADWVRKSVWAEKNVEHCFPTYVTDGPFLHRLQDGTLIMLWSSLGSQGYAMGTSRAEKGHITDIWRHDPEPIWAQDGGHGMIFKTFTDQLILTFHRPNNSPLERAVFIEIKETDKGIQPGAEV